MSWKSVGSATRHWKIALQSNRYANWWRAIAIPTDKALVRRLRKHCGERQLSLHLQLTWEGRT
jgi:hypothetical protein